MRVGINTYYKITQEFPVPSKTTNCGIGRWYKECEIEGFSSTNDGEDKSQKQWSVKARVRVWNVTTKKKKKWRRCSALKVRVSHMKRKMGKWGRNWSNREEELIKNEKGKLWI